MVGIITIVAYCCGMIPSLNFSLKVPVGLCNRISICPVTSITTWLSGTTISTASTTAIATLSASSHPSTPANSSVTTTTPQV